MRTGAAEARVLLPGYGSATFRRLSATSVALLRRMYQEWPELQRRYRAAAGELTSVNRWTEAFETWGSHRV